MSRKVDFGWQTQEWVKSETRVWLALRAEVEPSRYKVLITNSFYEDYISLGRIYDADVLLHYKWTNK